MRLPDWERRLAEFIAENRDRPFKWGEWDCILGATAADAAMTGIDKAVEFRNRYTDAEGAKLALREIGKGTLLRTIDHHYDRRPVGKARRGDLVWFKGSVGICTGHAGLFVGEERLADKAGIAHREGLIAIPRALLEKAWTV